MAEALRVVERLRLRAPSEALVRRAVVRLDDALRTASLPDRGARLVIVRRLDLGRIEATVSAQSLALALEARIASLGALLVHGGEVGAASADAVWFRDPLEAHSLAALQAAGGSPLDAWYWPLAVPALRSSRAPDPVLRTLAFSVARLPEASAALPDWTATLVLAGHADRLLATLSPGDGSALLCSAGLGSDPPLQRPITLALDSTRLGAGSSVRRFGGEGPDDDDRRAFLHAMLRRARTVSPSSVGAERRLSSRGDEVIDQGAAGRAREAVPRSESGEAAEALRDPGLASALSRGAALRVHSSEGVGEVRAGSIRQDEREARTVRAPGTAEADGGRTEPSTGRICSGRQTRAGGLLFLVPVLARLGFERWWKARGEAESETPDSLAAAIFARLLRRLRVESDDPMWDMAWRTAPAHGLSLPVAAADLWLSGCRHLLRRRVRIGLGHLVLRPASLALTPTHADVFFALDAADLRVRRAGLDIDPGWVPWLGLVLEFHYGNYW